MAEPQKPIIRQSKAGGRNPDHKIIDKATNDTNATSRAGGSDNNSLMREISIRNNRQVSGEGGKATGGTNIP